MSDVLALADQAREQKHSFRFLFLALILSAYICARVLEIVPSAIPRTAVVVLDVLSAMAFALVDGARRYGLRGILAFTAICAIVGNVVENLGVATGFPFGRYEFAGLMGPKLFHVPVLLGPAYIGMGYVSWTLANAILSADSERGSRRYWLVPILAGAVMTAWDLAQDPVWATVLRGWIWRDGGPWFGVPVLNYFGWYATNFCIYLIFTIYLRWSARDASSPFRPDASGPILFYALCAAGNVLQLFSRAVATTVQDPTGRTWRVANITLASALVSIFVMGSFALTAWLRRRRASPEATD